MLICYSASQAKGIDAQKSQARLSEPIRKERSKPRAVALTVPETLMQEYMKLGISCRIKQLPNHHRLRPWLQSDQHLFHQGSPSLAHECPCRVLVIEPFSLLD